MKYSPILSVILPIFNGEKFLAPAIQSILDQTFTDFELIAIDDGSTDNSLRILQDFQKIDSRILIITRENKGLVYSLNEGITVSRGKYIARMDADDISFPQRFFLQYEYMEKNPDVVLLGVGVTRSLRIKWTPKKLTGKKETTWSTVFYNIIGHPGVMLRKSTLTINNLCYSDDYKYVEDFKLWSELIKFGYADVLPQKLLFYRIHPHSVSILHKMEQTIADRKVVRENILDKFSIDMFGSLNLNDQSWINSITDNIFICKKFKDLPDTEKIIFYKTYLEYCSGFGIKAYIYCIKKIGLKCYLLAPKRIPITIYRAMRRQFSVIFSR